MTSRTRPRRRFFRMPRPGDDNGTMAILMLVMMVGLALSALLVPMIISQDRSTRFSTTRVQALDAAQAGIDVSVGLIRSAVSSGVGDSGKLPCAPTTAPLTGTVSSTSPAAYSVVVEYFTFDPVREAYPSSNAMKCAPGYGTYDTATSVITPSYARITSNGTVGTATAGSTTGRTLVTSYVFKTSNVNIAGGVIQISGSSLCMDVGSTTPVAGAAVALQSCSTSTPPIAQQVFAYRKDLTIQLLSSVTSTNATGLCLNSASLPAASGDAVQLSQCGPLGTPATYTQQWSYNDNGQYQAASSTSSTNGGLPNLCMNAASQAATQPVVLSSCSGAAQWIPAPSVGPGAAALPQWVNYQQFGRCLDVTNQDITSSHLIDYPCKQNPYPGAVTWNQKFTAPAIPSTSTYADGTFYTTVNGNNYCLTSPGSNGSYVTMGPNVNGTITPCSGLTTQNWRFYSGASALPYSKKYTIVDSSGLCLGWTNPNGGETWSAIDVETCTGALDQKWNADPNVLNASLQNTQEK